MADGDASPVPVLLVTGVLGAGKTSLINAMLNAPHGLALAVVVNDFGAINIDEAILSATGQPVYGLKNGCICCSLQGDLLRTLRAILSVRSGLDGIVIEASGVSDPRGIMSALCDPVLADAVRLDAVATVVDAEEHDPEDELWRMQVTAADFVFLSKTGTADVVPLRARLERMGKTLVFAADETPPVSLLFGRGFRHDPQDGAHIADDRFARLDWSSPALVSLPHFQSAVGRLAPHVARAKGFVNTEGQSYVFQLVGRRASLTPSPEPREGTQLVFIGKAGLFDAAHARTVLDGMVAAGE